MKKSELTLTGETYRLTPDSWGDTNIMVDEDAVIAATADAFNIPVDECDPDADENDKPDTCEIATDAEGNFFAIIQNKIVLGYGKYEDVEMARPCENPADATFGAALVFGRWEQFDDEDDE
jgi:hypothetical protein